MPENYNGNAAWEVTLIVPYGTEPHIYTGYLDVLFKKLADRTAYLRGLLDANSDGIADFRREHEVQGTADGLPYKLRVKARAGDAANVVQFVVCTSDGTPVFSVTRDGTSAFAGNVTAPRFISTEAGEAEPLVIPAAAFRGNDGSGLWAGTDHLALDGITKLFAPVVLRPGTIITDLQMVCYYTGVAAGSAKWTGYLKERDASPVSDATYYPEAPGGVEAVASGAAGIRNPNVALNVTTAVGRSYYVWIDANTTELRLVHAVLTVRYP